MPGTLYGERLNQIDFRITRVFSSNFGSFEGQFDLYNLFNASPVTAVNNRYGPNWQQPISILQGRLIKFGLLMNF